MSYEEATTAMRMLEDATTPFDYEKSSRYAMLVKDFIRRSREYCEANGLPLESPFVDTTNHLCELTKDLIDRLLIVAQVRHWSPVCVRSCKEYLKFLLNKEQVPDSQRDATNLYEPLFKLLVEGGDFYEHHGDVCIRDAATVVVSKN